MERKKTKFKEIIENGSSDALAILICFNFLSEDELENLTLKQCLKAAKCSLFKNRKKSEKIYHLLLKKAKTTEDFIKIFEEENFARQENELWESAKKAAKFSWDFYILFIHTDIKNPEKDFFFKKIQDNLKSFEEAKKILEMDIWYQRRYFSDHERFLLIEIVKRFAKTFDDFYFLLNCQPTTEEKSYYFKKAKDLVENFVEGKKLLECSNFITKKEKIELFKSISKLIQTKEELSSIFDQVSTWRERMIIIKNYLNKKKD